MQTVRVGIGVILINNVNQILLGKRRSEHGYGSWAVPGGHLEFGESFEACAIREAAEETGMTVEQPTFFCITNDHFPNLKHYISIYMKAVIIDNQTPKIKEPDKISQWQWFDFNNLPSPLFLPIVNLLNSKSYGSRLETLFLP